MWCGREAISGRRVPRRRECHRVVAVNEDGEVWFWPGFWWSSQVFAQNDRRLFQQGRNTISKPIGFRHRRRRCRRYADNVVWFAAGGVFMTQLLASLCDEVVAGG